MIFRTFLYFFISVVPLSVLAVTTAPGGGGGGRLDNPLEADTIIGLLTAILDIIIIIAVPFIVLAIIYTGFLFVTAQGNEDKLNKAKSAFMWTVIGALAILGAKVLAEAISGTVDQLGERAVPAIVEIIGSDHA